MSDQKRLFFTENINEFFIKQNKVNLPKEKNSFKKLLYI